MLVVGDLKDFLDKDYDKLEEKINNTKGIKLKDLRLQDLIFDKNQVIDPNTGVYIFSRNEKVMYVGKCGSRSLLERVPAHFDFRHDAWLSTYLSYVTREKHRAEFEKYNKLKKQRAKLKEDKNLERRIRELDSEVNEFGSTIEDLKKEAYTEVLNSNLKIISAKKENNFDYPKTLEKLLRVRLNPELNCFKKGTRDKIEKDIKGSTTLEDILKSFQ